MGYSYSILLYNSTTKKGSRKTKYQNQKISQEFADKSDQYY